MGGYESFEYDRLVERGFRPYSSGHRHMYEASIVELAETFGERGARVFEAGFGIGWGLGRMLEADILKSYVGVEPNFDSYAYTVKTHAETPAAERLTLVHSPFVEHWYGAFDAAFCIEVIEHVPAARHADFLQRLRTLAPRLYFSTPDVQKVPREGVRTHANWLALLEHAGFGNVRVDRTKWTDLYLCA